MTDKEFLQHTEQILIWKMLMDCQMTDGYQIESYTPENATVLIRASDLSRLIDIAKEKNR